MFSIQRSTLGAVIACAFAFSLSGCHSSSVQRAVSPLAGTWRINGPLPSPDANLPRFTQFTFRRDGTLDASYVAAGGALAQVIKPDSQVRQEQDSYTLVGEHHLRIIEGSRALEYRYDVRDGKLFLTGPGSDTATVYTHVTSSKSDDEEDGAGGAGSDSNNTSQ